VALLRYAAADVFRSRRRTLTAVLGVLLAVTFIAGTFIAIDSSTRATLDGILANYPADIQFQAGPGNATQIREAVEAIPGIVRVATWRNAQFSEMESASSGGRTYAQVVGIEPDRPPSFLDGITVTAGSLSLPRGTVALSEDLAKQVNVTMGGTAAFVYRSYNITGNETLTRLDVTVGGLFRNPYTGQGPFYAPATALVQIRDVDWYEQQLGVVSYGGNSIGGEIRIYRDRLLDPYDLAASQRNLARLDRQIDEVLAPFQGHVTIDYVGNAISNFATTITIQRIIYLALSTPVLLLGVYLGAIGVDLGHAERRRELAVLKTRGATPRQLVGLLLVEASLGGAIAAIVGLVAGVGLSRLLLTFVSPFSTPTAPRYEVVVLTPSTVVIVTILSVTFMAITSIRSARRTARIPIVETLRYYAPGEARIQYRPWVDILLITLAVVTYGMVLYARTNPQDFFTFLIGALFFIVLPFTPIFLIVGTTRLLTRATGRVYEWTARVCKPFAKNLYYVISRNLRRNPRRSANVAVIIALGIAFGMFILVTFSSQLAYQERQVRSSVGADVALDAPPSNATFAANLSALPEVGGVTLLRTVPGSVPYCCAGVYALDPATFFAVTNPEPWYFSGGGGAEAARQVLAIPGQVLVTEAYLRNAYLAVGDRLRLEGSVYNGMNYTGTVIVNTTIGGTVRGLPGTTYYGFGMPQTIYGSLDTMGPLLDGQPYRGYGADRFLIALRANADWRAAKADIVALGASNVQVAAEQIEQLRSNPVFRAFFGFIELEMAFMVVILTAGLGVILYAATLERDVELAAIRARGASGWQTAGLLIGEATSIMLIGLIVGTGIGILAAYLSTTFIAAGPGTAGESLVPVLFVLPPEALLLLVFAPAAMLLTSFAVTIRVARMDIARVLKLRGG